MKYGNVDEKGFRKEREIVNKKKFTKWGGSGMFLPPCYLSAAEQALETAKQQG